MPTLTVFESMKVLRKYGIPVADSVLVRQPNELKNAIDTLGYPLAMKLVSSTISHKTDVGGVKLFLKTADETEHAFVELQQINGFEAALVQHQHKGVELIVGGKVDAQFGPSLLFGIGGVFVEIFQDVSMRICPIDETDAIKMIHEIKGYPLLAGARGLLPVNQKALVDVLLKTSQLMMNENIDELDINPLIATSEIAVAVDARIVTKEKTPQLAPSQIHTG